MSRFLRHLVQRSLAPSAAGIQPRVLSRFDHGRNSARFVEENRETVAPFYPTRLPDPPASARSSATVLQPPFTTPRAEAEFTPEPQRKATEKSASSQTDHPMAAPVVLHSAQPSMEKGPAPSWKESVPPVERIHTVTNVVIDRLKAASREVRVESRVEQIHPATITRERESAVPVNRRETRIQPRIEERPVAPRAEPAFQQIEPSPAPTIHVTIGHIDIRAVHTPAPPHNAPAAPERRPMLSLDAYLKQRGAS